MISFEDQFQKWSRSVKRMIFEEIIESCFLFSVISFLAEKFLKLFPKVIFSKTLSQSAFKVEIGTQEVEAFFFAQR